MSLNKPNLPVIPRNQAWQAEHDSVCPGGPLGLTVAGQRLLKRCFNACGHKLTDKQLLPEKTHLFRKAGTAIFEGIGHFPSGLEAAIRQTTRYDVNTARTTVDLTWNEKAKAPGDILISAVELTGHWQRCLVFPDFQAWAKGQRPYTLDLTAGQTYSLAPSPLAAVLENDDGARLEISLGNDVWRWQAGLGCQPSPADRLDLDVKEDGVLCRRSISQAGKAGENLPEKRVYRFTSVLAWLAPGETVPEASLAGTRLSISAANGLSQQELAKCGDNPSVILDFADIAWPENALRTLDAGVCWESNPVQNLARRLIRQLADYASCGKLTLLGLTPGLCDCPKHCLRRKQTPHWDLDAILDFAAWMRHRLGPNWQINVPQPAPWNLLPSLAKLGCQPAFGPDEDAQ
jgi:hypothetical protein